ncbi:DUF2057 domain-containing protein [Vibrio albus]|uniref:DUF2057 domain-containing protein n=1 Tax=Vibrio albus TaxID=2200953 RepID=A0A2U3BAW8_9VIBR|nr:DUF2057 domain-containing protein [Vibrio albus]PWI33913.1 DUF2057 domain-containing protein [Vibrio albus]
MRITKFVLLALTSVASFTHAASLDLPYSVDFLALNGVEQDSKDVLASLKPGRQQVIIRYSEELRDGSTNELYVSKPLVLNLDVKADSDEYSLDHKNFRTYKAAEAAFDNNKAGWTLEHNGISEVVYPEELLADGFMPYANIEKAIRAHNKEKGIVLTSSGATNVTEAVVSVSDSGEVEITGDPVTQLKLWYTKASKDERKAFRIWMIDQD